MGASGHRFSAVPVVIGLAFCVASACGGPAGSPLDHPAGRSSSQGDDSSAGSLDAENGSSSGGAEDATLDDSNPGDMASDAAGGSSGDDVGSPPPMDTGPDASGMCGVCFTGYRCCATPGAFYYRQCYNVLCGACCL